MGTGEAVASHAAVAAATLSAAGESRKSDWSAAKALWRMRSESVGADGEGSDVESSDADKSDGESSDSERADAESSDGERSDAERSDSERSDSGRAEAVAEPSGAVAGSTLSGLVAEGGLMCDFFAWPLRKLAPRVMRHGGATRGAP